MAIARDRRSVHRRRAVNVGSTERFLSMLLGGALAYRGIRKGSFGGFLRAATGGYLLYRGQTGHCEVYEAAGIDTSGSISIEVKEALTINRPPEEVYRFWRDMENFPNFMEHLESVRLLDRNRYHWIARTPGGVRVEWDSEITMDRPNEALAWRSLPNSDIDHEGRVEFRPAPGARGTELRVQMFYNPPAGPVGTAVARFFNFLTRSELREDLYRLKHIIETGESPTVEGQVSGVA